MSCDRRCFDPQNPWYEYEDCDTCGGRDDGHIHTDDSEKIDLMNLKKWQEIRRDNA